MLNLRSTGRWIAAPLLALAVMGTLFVAAPSGAQERAPRQWRPPVASWSSVTVSLEDESGRPLRTFMQQGQTFVLGQMGERYNIRVRNPLNRRVEVVVSVDGRDVVSGNPADFVRNRGYVIAPGDSLVVEGFRTSLSEVAAFRFTDPSDSYSARRGTPQNVGVVGVAFFGERAPQAVAAPTAEAPKKKSAPRRRQSSSEPRSADGAGSASEGRRAQKLGTEFGESMSSQVRQVMFERETPRHPSRLITLRYDDAEGLEARGIDVFGNLRRAEFVEPQAFPESRFAPPPPR